MLQPCDSNAVLLGRIHLLGLYEDELKGCTDRLQTWNIPRKRNVVPLPTDEVTVSKKEYGTDKRCKVHRVNSWDCRPVSKRIVDPNKARNLHNRLAVLEQCKMNAADKAVLLATTESEKKKASQTKAMLTRYGTSCFLQLLDEDAPPAVENRIEVMKRERQERLDRTAAKKKKYLSELATAQQSIRLDHSYACTPDASKSCVLQDQVVPVQQQDLVDKLYYNHVWLSPDSCRQLATSTQAQSDSERWHKERKLRITASIMKEVCHRKATTSCEAFVRKKLSPGSIDIPAIRYGSDHESVAIKSYMDYQRKMGKSIVVNSCGLSVHPSLPWLATTPDGIVYDASEEHYKRGCLEVKCPFSCNNMLFEVACKEVSNFCLVLDNTTMSLSKRHAYYYQVQTQMYVTQLSWCDFVVWSPIQSVFVEWIVYDPVFMKSALQKAQAFYFGQFLPSVVPHTIFSDSPSTKSSSSVYLSQTNPLVFESKPNTPISPSKTKPPVSKTSIIEATPPPIFKTMTVTPVSLSRTTPPLSITQVPPLVSPAIPVSLSKATPPVSITPTVKATPLISPATPVSLSKTTPPLSKSLFTPGPVAQSKTIPSAFAPKKEELEIISITKQSLPSLPYVLQQLSLQKHSVYGDGSCLYHAIAHQAGFVDSSSRGCRIISRHLRQMVVKVMSDNPAVRLEDGLSTTQWLERQQAILNPAEWGGDLEVRLLVIGLKRDIVVLTVMNDSASYARRFPCQPPPIPKMTGGIFIPVTTQDLCKHWKSFSPPPLLIIYNGHSHYDSAVNVGR